MSGWVDEWMSRWVDGRYAALLLGDTLDELTICHFILIKHLLTDISEWSASRYLVQWGSWFDIIDTERWARGGCSSEIITAVVSKTRKHGFTIESEIIMWMISDRIKFSTSLQSPVPSPHTYHPSPSCFPLTFLLPAFPHPPTSSSPSCSLPSLTLSASPHPPICFSFSLLLSDLPLSVFYLVLERGHL